MFHSHGGCCLRSQWTGVVKGPVLLQQEGQKEGVFSQSIDALPIKQFVMGVVFLVDWSDVPWSKCVPHKHVHADPEDCLQFVPLNQKEKTIRQEPRNNNKQESWAQELAVVRVTKNTTSHLLIIKNEIRVSLLICSQTAFSKPDCLWRGANATILLLL